MDLIRLGVNCEHPDWIGLDWIWKNGPVSNSGFNTIEILVLDHPVLMSLLIF